MKIQNNRIFKKDSSFFKLEENVFDIPTLKTLSDFVNNKIITSFSGSISTGKEANIFYAIGSDNKELAIKIYRIKSSTFKSMDSYIIKDKRFENIKHSKKDIVFSWAKKEYQNLIRLKKINLYVPNPIAVKRNIVIMSFLGLNGIPYPQLRKIKLEKNIAYEVFNSIIESMKNMYTKASLIHSDLSEYNILINPKNNNPIFIDVGQSILNSNPLSNSFLRRDIKNILNYFSKYNINFNEKTIYNFITEDKLL